MAEQAARTRAAAAIEAFAAGLRALRDSVGNPSFREMSGRSRAISHTTLHEAAQGNRLPSWATTVEYVKACNADPAAYRERWEQANRLVRSMNSLRPDTLSSDSVSRSSASIAIPATGTKDRRAIHVAIDREPASPDASSDPPMPPPPDAAPDDDTPVAPAPPNRRRSRFVLPAVAAVGVIAVAVAVAVTVGSGSESPGKNKPTGTAPSAQARLSANDCPVHQRNPPPAPAAHPGDASAFIADITLPDCSHIRGGQTATKVWRLKNVGTASWTGYSLHRLDLPQQRNQCQTISDVPINDTAPGALVDIRTEVTAPQSPGFCFVRFKMVDASGHVVFPGSRPVNFQLIVD